MEQPKENHPIDELFVRKLHDYEQKPRPQAWEKLEARIQQKKSGALPLWIKYSAAASVALLMTAGWLVYQQSTVKPIDTIAVTKQPIRKSIPEKIEQPAIAEQQSTNESKSVVEPSIQIAEVKSVSEKNLKSEKKIKIAPEIKRTQYESPVIEKVAVNEPVSTLSPIVTPKVEVAHTGVVTEPKLAASTEEKVFVVKVTEAEQLATNAVSDSTEKKAKSRFLSKLAKGWKHIQDGEWKEVGLDGKTLLARSDK